MLSKKVAILKKIPLNISGNFNIDLIQIRLKKCEEFSTNYATPLTVRRFNALFSIQQQQQQQQTFIYDGGEMGI